MFPNRMAMFSNLAIVRAQSHSSNLILLYDQLFCDKELSTFPFESAAGMVLTKRQHRLPGSCLQQDSMRCAGHSGGHCQSPQIVPVSIPGSLAGYMTGGKRVPGHTCEE